MWRLICGTIQCNLLEFQRIKTVIYQFFFKLDICLLSSFNKPRVMSTLVSYFTLRWRTHFGLTVQCFLRQKSGWFSVLSGYSYIHSAIVTVRRQYSFLRLNSDQNVPVSATLPYILFAHTFTRCSLRQDYLFARSCLMQSFSHVW